MKDSKKGCSESIKDDIAREERMKVLGLPQEDIDILEEIKYGRPNTRHREC